MVNRTTPVGTPPLGATVETATVKVTVVRRRAGLALDCKPMTDAAFTTDCPTAPELGAYSSAPP